MAPRCSCLTGRTLGRLWAVRGRPALVHGGHYRTAFPQVRCQIRANPQVSNRPQTELRHLRRKAADLRFCGSAAGLVRLWSVGAAVASACARRAAGAEDGGHLFRKPVKLRVLLDEVEDLVGRVRLAQKTQDEQEVGAVGHHEVDVAILLG